MKPDYEIRSWVKQMELRAADTKKFPKSIGTLEGYAAKFNSPSVDMGGFKEVICPGCFTRSLSMNDDRHDVRGLYAHDKTRVLARKSAGSLEIGEDSTGLWIRMHLINTTDGRDALANVEAGNLDAMSFGFLPMEKPTWKRENDSLLRNITSAHLMEVSIVAWAQYPDTELAVRELESFKIGEKPIEKTGTPLRLLRQRQAFLNSVNLNK